MAKGFTGKIITEIERDEETGKWFFLLKQKNGEPKRYESVDKGRLRRRRKDVVAREDEKAAKQFEKKMPKEKIEKLKKSASGKTTEEAVVARSGNVELLQTRKKVILEGKIKGLSDAQIKILVSNEFGVSQIVVAREINAIEEQIRAHAIVSHEEILLSHMNKYEALYAKFREDGADAYALRALRNKENVAGLHDQTVNIQVNNYIDSEFSINLLSAEKQKRLKELLLKVRVK